MTVWGQNDCCLFPANWILSIAGIDGGALWRGTYADEDQCLAVLERDGGVRAVMARGAALVGLPPTTNPVRGDVGVIRVRTFRGEPLVGAICTGRRWAVMSAQGVRSLRGEVEAAWSAQYVL